MSPFRAGAGLTSTQSWHKSLNALREGKIMSSAVSSVSKRKNQRGAELALKWIIPIIPAVLLFCGSFLNATGEADGMLLAGAAVQVALFGCLAIFHVSRRAGPSQLFVFILYLIGLGWVWHGSNRMDEWFSHLSSSCLLIVPVVQFVGQYLSHAGVLEMRRARQLARRLKQRRHWPSQRDACRELSDVKALRRAVHGDATPALELLDHPRTEVQVAALAALEFHPRWRPGQAELVLQIAQNATDISVRVAATMALGNLKDQRHLQALAALLRDPADEVRRAAAEALLWDVERRWNWISDAVRSALADPMLKDDGPLPLETIDIGPEVIKDLTSWCGEKGILGMRAAATLAAYYRRVLGERPSAALVQSLHQQLANQQLSPILRLELAHLLRDSHDLDHNLVRKLLDAANPTLLRLFAVDTLLAEKTSMSKPIGEPSTELTALREIAELPNRDIALATAAVIQRHLGIDFGLALEQPMPALHSRMAADVARRVLRWAARKEIGPCKGNRQPPTKTSQPTLSPKEKRVG